MAQEFLLSPLQLGIPYSRPRYYALARRKGPGGACPFPARLLPTGQPICCPPTSVIPCEVPNPLASAQNDLNDSTATSRPRTCDHRTRLSANEAAPQSGKQSGGTGVRVAVASLADFLVDRPSPGDGILVSASGSTTAAAAHDRPDDQANRRLSSAEAACSAQEDFFWVPDNVIEQWREVLDIVVPSSQRCNCFTKTYTRYTKVPLQFDASSS